MNDTEFNLIDEPWIRVIDKSCNVTEVSLKDAILNAHEYRALGGELPTQDVAVMRLILAVLHTVISRYDEYGDENALEDDEDEALERWKAWWDNGKFPEKAVSDYLGKWHERFWLFHPERPFFQITESDMMKQINGQKRILMSKLNAEISKSGNKKNFFSFVSEEIQNTLSYSQAARWLVNLNSFDDSAIKPQGKNMDSATVSWCGQLGLVYLLGENLFETLMLNLVMINCDCVEYKELPIWEKGEINIAERQNIAFPDNLAELYTFQSRRIHLFRDNERIIYFHNLAGDLLSNKNAFNEPMTIWKRSKGKVENYEPMSHDSPKQMWKEFSVLYQKDGNQRAGIINWYNNYLYANSLIGEKSILKTSILSVKYDSSSSHKILNFYSDSLTMHSAILSELGKGWRSSIETEIKHCDELAGAISRLAQNLYVASGGSNSSKDKRFYAVANDAKEQLYYRLDMPFREWLRSIEPKLSNQEKQDKISEWQKTAQNTAMRYADELIADQPEIALIGHSIDSEIYSAPKAKNIFISKVKKIYEEI